MVYKLKQLKSIFKLVIGIILKKFNLKLIRLHRYMKLIQEVEGLFEFIFPNLPATRGRIELLADLAGTETSEAFYLLEYLHRSFKLKGDVCEFGVAGGRTSALLANEIRATKKKLWLFDSFKGLPRPSKKDFLINDILQIGSIDRYEGAMSHSIYEVKFRLKSISFPSSRIRIIPGFIEETLSQKKLPERVCFAYVDLDFYNPILTTLYFLDKRLSESGVIVVDDYGFFSSGVKIAVDEFMLKYSSRYIMTFPYKFAGNFCILQKTALA